MIEHDSWCRTQYRVAVHPSPCNCHLSVVVDLERQLKASEDTAVRNKWMAEEMEAKLAEVRQQASEFYNKVRAALGTNVATTNAIEHFEWVRG